MMRYMMMLTAILCGLTACDAAVAPRDQAVEPVQVSQDTQSDVTRARYQCDGTLVLDVVFGKDYADVTMSDTDTIRVPIAVSGSGFRYSTGIHELRGKGTEATWTIGRRMPIQCQAIEE